MEKIMMDGEPLEVGDRVYSMYYGWGIVNALIYGNYPIQVKMDIGKKLLFTDDFKFTINHCERGLYWQKPEIIPPPKIKPKKRIKVWDWLVIYNSGKIMRVDGVPEDTWKMNETCIRLVQKIDGTEREIEAGE